MTAFATMSQALRRWAQKNPEAPAIYEQRADGTLVATSWARYYEQAREVAKGLIDLGLGPGDTVLLLADERSEWLICQQGIHAAGGVVVPLDAKLFPEQIVRFALDCEAPFAVCDTREGLKRLLASERRDGARAFRNIITMDEMHHHDERIVSLAELVRRGEARPDRLIDPRLAAVEADDIALILYMPYSHGPPKGVLCTHRAIHRSGRSLAEAFGHSAPEGARYSSFQPLHLPIEQTFSNFLVLTIGATVYLRHKARAAIDSLRALRPEIVFAESHVWEELEASVRDRLAQEKGLRALLTRWALREELGCFHQEMAQWRPAEGIPRLLANQLVIDKLKMELGIDRLRVACVGMGKVSRATFDLFASIGVALLEGYALTETTGFATLQPVHRIRFGTAGVPLAGVEIRIDERGEIVFRGETMSPGYRNRPEDTAALRQGGWLHSGDVGEIDEDGYLIVRGAGLP